MSETMKKPEINLPEDFAREIGEHIALRDLEGECSLAAQSAHREVHEL